MNIGRRKQFKLLFFRIGSSPGHSIRNECSSKARLYRNINGGGPREYALGFSAKRISRCKVEHCGYIAATDSIH
jgi:hypothetical protein